MTARITLITTLIASLLTACGFVVSDSERIGIVTELMEEGDYRGAAVQLKSLLIKSPDNYDARLLLARVHLGQNDIQSAEKEVQTASELGAPTASVSILRLDILAARDEHTEVLAALGLVEDMLSPSQRLKYRGMALVGLQSGDAAAQTYREWLEIEPDSLDAAVGLAKVSAIQGRVDEAIAMLNGVVTRDQQHADGWLALAILHYGQGDYEQARRAYRQSLAAREPQSEVQQTVIALFGLADTDLMLQDAGSARGSIELLKQFVPAAPETMFQSARLSLLEQDYPEAARKLQRLNQLLPDNVRVLTLLATVQWRLGNVQQASSHLSRVVSLAPNNLHARKMLAQIQLRQSNTSAALETLDPLLKLQEGDSELYSLLAIADLQSGNSKRAVERLRESIRLKPDDAASTFQLAEVFLHTGEPEKAVDLLAAGDLPQSSGFRRERILLVAYQQLDEIEKASDIARQLTEIQPPAPEALNLAAEFYFLVGRTLQSREVLERSRTLDPNNIDTLLRLAQFEISAHQPESARALYNSVNRIDTDNLSALIGIARVSFETGDSAAAIQFLKLAIEKHATEVLPRLLLARTYYATGNIDAAETLAREIIQIGSSDPTINRSLGRLLMQLGAMEEAKAQFEAAVHNAPASMDALLDLAHFFVAQDDMQQAKGVIDRALSLNPASRSAQAAMVIVEIRQGYSAAAAERLADLQRRFPDDLALSILHGEVLFSAGAFQDAAYAFNKAVLNGAGLNTAIREVESLRLANSGQDPASPLLNHLSKNPGDLMAQMQLAQHYQRNGDSADAIRAYEHLLTSGPDDPVVLNNLAWEYHQVGDLGRARELAEKARAIMPDSGDIADTLGIIFRSLGDFEQSIEYLRDAVALSPYSAEIRYHLAATLADAGRNEEALTILAAIIDSKQEFPSRADAQVLIARLSE